MESPRAPVRVVDGLLVVVKRDCPTCTMLTPVLTVLAASAGATVVSQDDPGFPEGVDDVVDDSGLDLSWQLEIDTVPTILHMSGGQEVGRTIGWDRSEWEEISGLKGLGPGLPDRRPGCGSRTSDPALADVLDVRHRGHILRSRRVELSALEDDFEAIWTRGWTDGLPVVPPTEARVLRMLDGTVRPPDEVVATVPPNLVPATVEKVAINAVLAGCRPEYLPVVLTAVEAACTDEFNIHGVLATTWSVGPVVVVNGPIVRAIGMNSGINVLGQGNRANSTIGRALQLVVRNIGGGQPGGVDRATLGNPGKIGLAFAEDEAGSPWEPLSVERGLRSGVSAVTVVAAGGMHSIADQSSRDPESLAESLARWVGPVDSLLLVSPDHGRVFREAGWSKARLRAALQKGPAERSVELLIVYAGGAAGLFSGAMEGWIGGSGCSVPVTRELRP